MSDIEVGYLKREISFLDHMINQLQERRGVLQNRLNVINAPIKTIPPETLSLIFQFACPPDFTYCQGSFTFFEDQCSLATRPLCTLGQVSAHWRQVAWSTPQLWTSLSIKVNKSNAPILPYIFLLHLQNTGNLPFSLNLSICLFSPPPSESLDTIKKILFDTRYSNKFQALRLYVPTDWLTFSSHFPRLEYLSLSALSGHSNTTPLENLPGLRHVYLEGLSGQISLSWSSITGLELNIIPINICLKLFIQCPNLTSFRAFNLLRPDGPVDFHGSITVFRHLRKFSWNNHPSPLCVALFQRVRFPVLRTLHWEGGYLGEIESPLRALFSKLPNTLLTLELTTPVLWTPPLIRYILGQASSVQELVVSNLDDNCLYDIFCALCPGDDPRTLCLPFLNRLAIKDCYENGDAILSRLGTKYAARILDMCKARRRSNSFFRLDLGEMDVDWTEEAFLELRKMVRNGFRLEVSPEPDHPVLSLYADAEPGDDDFY